MIRSLITGGAGAIGSNLISTLLREGHEVVVLDDLSSGYRENVPPNVEFHQGSVVDKAIVAQLVNEAGFDYVFHLAALFANQNSVDNPMKDLEVNGSGSLNLMLCLANAANAKRFQRLVYGSSSCVYGQAAGMVAENTSYSTGTPYAVTKLMGEYYAQYFIHHYRMPITIVRPFNSYGPGERPGRYRNVIPNFIHRALRGEPLEITGTGDETRDFTFVNDVTECFLRAATSERSLGETYNVGTGRETKIRDLVQQIIARTGFKSEVRYLPRRSWDHVNRRCANVSKAKSHLGFEAKTPLEAGLDATISWIKSLPASS